MQEKLSSDTNKLIKNIPCVILSGGKSTRMGEDKALLPFNEFNTMIEYQYNKFSKIFQNVYISSKTDKFNFKAKIIYDNNKEISSPMIALDSILDFIIENKVFIVSVDTPFIKYETIYKLIIASKGNNITIPIQNNHKHYLCGVYDKKVHKTIKYLLSKNIHQLKQLLKEINNTYELNLNNKIEFININYKDEYKIYNYNYKLC